MVKTAFFKIKNGSKTERKNKGRKVSITGVNQ